jgi:hypothetical protein
MQEVHMPDRASIFQNAQIGVEITPGTAVLATKQLSSLMISMGMKFDVKKYRPSGYRFPTIVVPNKEWVEHKLSGPITYTEMVYLLSSLIKTVTPTGAGAEKTWAFSPTTKKEDPHKTYTLEQGDIYRAHRVTNFLVTALTLNFSRDECTLDGTAISRALQDDINLSTDAKYTLTAAASPPTAGTFTLTAGGQTTAAIQYNATTAQVQSALEALSTVGTGNVIVTRTTGTSTLAQANAVYTVEFVADLGQQAVTMTGTFTGLTPASSIALASSQTGAAPTEIKPVPVLPTHICIYMADTQANLGVASPMNRVISSSFSLSDMYAALWALNRNVTSFAATIPTEPTLGLKLKVEADDEGMTPLTTLRAGQTRFFRIEAIGDTISSAPYKLNIDFAAKAEEPSEFSDEDGVFALEWSFTGVHDVTWGKATELTLVTDVASL